MQRSSIRAFGARDPGSNPGGAIFILKMDNVKVLLKAIIKKGDKFLVIQRSSDDVSRPNKWDFPGGNLEWGEDSMDCIVREIREETDLSVNGIRAFYVVSEKKTLKKELFWVQIGYVANYDCGEVKLSHEHQDYKWVDKDEFLKLESSDYLKEFVKNLV